MEITKSQAERDAEFDPIADRIWDAMDVLFKKKNVTRVGIGYKRTGNTMVEKMCFVVTVAEKMAMEELLPEDLIPQEIFGIPTDVIMPQAMKLLSDAPTPPPGVYTSDERPLIAGVELAGKVYGTLGCFARRNSDDSLVMLSNYHVMIGKGKDPAALAKKGDPVFQPLGSPVGKIVDFKRPDAGKVGKVDAAIATVNIPPTADNIVISNKIKGLGKRKNPGNPPDPDPEKDYTTDDEWIRGVALKKSVDKGNGVMIMYPVKVGERVRKVGRTTGRTIGEVVRIDILPAIPVGDDPADTPAEKRNYIGQFEIKPIDTNTEVSKDGDSGSVVVDDENRIAGLLFTGLDKFSNGGPSANDPDKALVNNIHDVLHALHISIYVPPVASFTTSAQGTKAPLTVQFNGQPSTDGEGSALTYLWDTGDRDKTKGVFVTGNGQTFSHIYTLPGKYFATLTVVDAHGLTGRKTQIIEVTP